MSKEMKVECDLIQNSLVCELPPLTLDVVLKVRTKSGEHTFREDVYTRTMKYRRWNNQMRPFRSLKKRVANIFRRRSSTSDDSWGNSTQTVINQAENQEDEIQSETNSSVSSDWSDQLLDIVHPSTSNNDNINKDDEVAQPTTIKRTTKSVILVPYKPKPKSWGSWRAKSPVTNTRVTVENHIENLNETNNNVEYVPHSPHYSPVHSPQFYEKGIN